MRGRKNSLLPTVLFLFLWTLFTLYPQPSKLFVSVYRLFNHPIDPYTEEVQYLIEKNGTLSPSQIETFTKMTISYQYDWETYRLPWYFPTVEEVFANRAGDCKSRMIVISSLLEASEIEHSVSASPTHIWVDYEGKTENSSENGNVAIFTFAERLTVHSSSSTLKDFTSSFWNAFWIYMPVDRKILLLSGALLSLWMSTPLSKKKLCLRLEKE